MTMFAGLDVGFKLTAVCVVDGSGRTVWRGVVDTIRRRTDGRRVADAVKSRRVKSDKADAYALAEMLRTGWYSAVHVKNEESHWFKALLGARDQLVRAKRALGNQVRGLLRPFGIRLPSRQGTKKFAEAAHQSASTSLRRTAIPNFR
jgi:transposase